MPGQHAKNETMEYPAINMTTMLYVLAAWHNDHCGTEDRKIVKVRNSGNLKKNMTCGMWWFEWEMASTDNIFWILSPQSRDTVMGCQKVWACLAKCMTGGDFKSI